MCWLSLAGAHQLPQIQPSLVTYFVVLKTETINRQISIPSYQDHHFQLKSDNSCNVSSVVSGGQSADQVTQVLQIPVDQKISAAHEITKSGPERMIPTQQVKHRPTFIVIADICLCYRW